MSQFNHSFIYVNPKKHYITYFTPSDQQLRIEVKQVKYLIWKERKNKKKAKYEFENQACSTSLLQITAYKPVHLRVNKGHIRSPYEEMHGVDKQSTPV